MAEIAFFYLGDFVGVGEGALFWVGFYGLFVFCWVVEGEFWVEFLLGFFAWLGDGVKIEFLFVWGVGIGI